MTQNEQPGFEQSLRELEEIVEKMESGKLTLEETIEAYARGTELSRICRDKLSDAQRRVAQLSERSREMSGESDPFAG